MAQKTEIWKQIKVKNFRTKFSYFVSSNGRFKSLLNDKERILRQKTIKDYKAVCIKSEGKTKTIFIHRLVAEYFGKTLPIKNNFVIHLDYNKENNFADNLKVVTKKDYLTHQNNQPNKLTLSERNALTTGKRGQILTKKKVEKLKKQLYKKNRSLTYKELAEKFNISEMTLYRIKRGELWYSVRTNEEPKNKNHKQYKKIKKKFKSLKNLIDNETT